MTPLLGGTRHVLGTPADEPTLNFTTGFRYVDHLVRERGRWRIAERWAIREWARSDAGDRLPVPASGPRGDRGPDDPMARLLDRL